MGGVWNYVSIQYDNEYQPQKEKHGNITSTVQLNVSITFAFDMFAVANVQMVLVYFILYLHK